MAGAASVLNIDGAETAGTATGSTAAAAASLFGIAATTCREAEAIFWDNYALTAGERAALTDNQKNYWMPLPLDSFRTPSGAYSFRKLKSTYSGPAIRIRRASDNAEADINFLGYVPGLGSPWDEAAANAHCAATTCFIRTWYDQSGLVRHLNQTTAANQPALIFNCQGTLPCARLIAPQAITGASVTPATGLVSISVVANRRTGTANCLFIEQNGFANRITGQNTVANSWILAGSTAASVVLADTAWHAVQGVINGASSAINADGVDATVSVTGTVTAGQPTISAVGASTCDVAEAAVWDNYGLTLAERAVLSSNQRGFWGF